MNLDDYPLFLPPAHLATKGRENWIGAEAAEYREWLLGILDNRVKALTVRLEEPFGPPAAEHLQSLSKKVASLLIAIPFSEEVANVKRLTDQGYALAADMGLLVAKYLMMAHPQKLSWETMKNPRELSFNLPVIRGFSVNYLDPVGGSIAEAAALLRGKRGADAWKDIYDFWITKA